MKTKTNIKAGRNALDKIGSFFSNAVENGKSALGVGG